MRKEKLIVIALITIGVLLGLSQTIIYYLKTPPGTYFPFVHNYIEDYYYYLHLMRQGWEGKWLATSWLTPEVFPPQFVNIWFLFLGHTARFFHLPLEVMYTTTRAVGAMALFVLSYRLIKLVYPESLQKRLIALGIVIFGTYWWGWNPQAGGPTVPNLVHQWTALDPLFRGSYIPHHLWSKIFMISAFLVMIKFTVIPANPSERLGTGAGIQSKNKTGSPIWLASMKLRRSGSEMILVLLVLLMGFTSPVTLVTFVPVIALWFVFERIAAKKTFFLWIFAMLLSIGMAYYYRTLEQGLFPWNSYKAWEDSMRYPIDAWSYLSSLGPQFILFLAAVPWLWKKTVGRLLVAWTATSWLLLFIIGSFLPISNSRFLDGYQFIPIGIGAVQGIWICIERITRGKRTLFHLLMPLTVGCLFLYFSLGLAASWREHRVYIEQNMQNQQVYMPQSYTEAFQFLDSQTPRQSVVLAPDAIGTMIPAFTGNRVVWGHPLMSQASTNKRQDITTFYSWSSASVLKQILTKYHVSYIWVTRPQSLTSEFQRRFNAKEVFSNSEVAIFQVY